LEALYAHGDAYTAFDPQTTHVEHVAIAELLAGARQAVAEDPRSGTPARSRDIGASRSWLRSRLKALLAGREQEEPSSTDTERVQSNVTLKPGSRPLRTQ
jgi:hypothetical protein